MTNADMMMKFQDWEAQRCKKNAMFKSMMNYLHRVEAILFFVAASRTADLKLHLEAGEALSKLFFAMVVQKLIKPTTVNTVKDLSECFNYKLMSLKREYDEVILVFDTYKSNSLKNATREKRRHGKDPIQYQIRDKEQQQFGF